MFLYFDGEISREEAIRLIKQNSRHYAKRQMTWFGADKTIHWLDAKMDYEKQMDTIIGWLRADSVR
jgi:tRNA dimethylallyltransferase